MPSLIFEAFTWSVELKVLHSGANLQIFGKVLYSRVGSCGLYYKHVTIDQASSVSEVLSLLMTLELSFMIAIGL
jgi:hypothetical protein